MEYVLFYHILFIFFMSFVCRENIFSRSSTIFDTITTHFRGVASNNGLGGRFKSGPFLYRKYERGIKKSNVSSSY